jgi:hypothetical protein
MIEAMIELISKRNPGAVDVCFRLADYLQELTIVDFAILQKDNILGSDLYDLYKCCDRDVIKLHACINQGTGIDMLKKVPGSSFYKGE